MGLIKRWLHQRRVCLAALDLKPDGRLIAEIVSPEQRSPGDFEATWWSSVDVVVAAITKAGFNLTARSKFEKPWQGIQAVFSPAG